MTVATAGPVIVLAPEGVEIPPGIVDLATFRDWARSDGFPERGRIDWIAGRMEVDMSPEDLFTHGTPKSAIGSVLCRHIQEPELGYVFIDRARISNEEADVSAEPDVLVVLLDTIEDGRARLIPKASGAPGRFIEIEGTADLVVEVISDSSKAKDAERLEAAYHRAGIREYWLVDARAQVPDLTVFHHRRGSYATASRARGGWIRSLVLARSVRFVRTRGKTTRLLPFFRLEVRPKE